MRLSRITTVAALLGIATLSVALTNYPAVAAGASATEDTQAIQQIIAEYSYTFDSGDSEGWSKLFTEDAVWESIRALSPDPLISLNGRDEILAWAKKRHAGEEGGPPSNIQGYHHQSGFSLDSLTATTARGRVMVLITAHDQTQASPEFSVRLAGVYHDEWRKTPEGWRFASRRLRW